jgi:hypothetical protein
VLYPLSYRGYVSIMFTRVSGTADLLRGKAGSGTVKWVVSPSRNDLQRRTRTLNAYEKH